MSDVVIKIENLSKKYIISHEKNGASYGTLRDSLAGSFKKLNPFSGESFFSNDSKEEFWALKDINLEIRQGEKVGIIGRNGAGKSTLLKILSRITEPTTGSVKIKGRIASLLEVGTGFHPELSGRENIYLNGAILGMTKAEIKRKFDEIVEFSGVEKFLDTPVKRYSSGMYVRLAFAVAAHLESEILLIDEVLAVGDAEFQKKCLGKMDDVAKQGRTVIFVSHNMGAIRQLCERGIILQKGLIESNNSIPLVLEAYHNLIGNFKTHHFVFKNYLPAQFLSAEVLNENFYSTNELVMGADFQIRFSVLLNDNSFSENLSIAILIKNSNNVNVVNFNNVDSGVKLNLSKGKNFFSINIKSLKLYPDRYYINLWMADKANKDMIDYKKEELSFNIIADSSKFKRKYDNKYGIIFIAPYWEISNE